ncbi:MAG TPA: hypothetical protein QGF58_24140 [Myxococcota bacterium]|nr:hypothetical protein [Myxococcota bacterium]
MSVHVDPRHRWRGELVELHLPGEVVLASRAEDHEPQLGRMGLGLPIAGDVDGFVAVQGWQGGDRDGRHEVVAHADELAPGSEVDDELAPDHRQAGVGLLQPQGPEVQLVEVEAPDDEVMLVDAQALEGDIEARAGQRELYLLLLVELPPDRLVLDLRARQDSKQHEHLPVSNRDQGLSARRIAGFREGLGDTWTSCPSRSLLLLRKPQRTRPAGRSAWLAGSMPW